MDKTREVRNRLFLEGAGNEKYSGQLNRGMEGAY